MWPFSEMSLSTATLVGTLANWGLLASLVASVISTFLIVKTADVKEEHWDKLRELATTQHLSMVPPGRGEPDGQVVERRTQVHAMSAVVR